MLRRSFHLLLLLLPLLLLAQPAPTLAAPGNGNGNGPSGDGPPGNGPTGDGPRGNGPTGDGPPGNGPSGNGPPGNGPAGNGPPGNSPAVNGNGNGNAFGHDRPPPATQPPATAITSEQDAALEAVQSGRALPLETILGAAKVTTPGEVLDARLVRVNGFLLYELKILSADGHSVSKAYYYARSGKLVGEP